MKHCINERHCGPTYTHQGGEEEKDDRQRPEQSRQHHSVAIGIVPVPSKGRHQSANYQNEDKTLGIWNAGVLNREES